MIEHDDDAGQVLGPAEAVGVPPGRGPPPEQERDAERHGGQRVGDVVQRVAEQRDRAGDQRRRRACSAAVTPSTDEARSSSARMPARGWPPARSPSRPPRRGCAGATRCRSRPSSPPGCRRGSCSCVVVLVRRARARARARGSLIGRPPRRRRAGGAPSRGRSSARSVSTVNTAPSLRRPVRVHPAPARRRTASAERRRPRPARRRPWRGPARRTARCDRRLVLVPVGEQRVVLVQHQRQPLVEDAVTSRTWQAYSSGDHTPGAGRSRDVRAAEHLLPGGGVLRASRRRRRRRRPRARRSRTPGTAGRAPRSSPWCPGRSVGSSDGHDTTSRPAWSGTDTTVSSRRTCSSPSATRSPRGSRTTSAPTAGTSAGPTGSPPRWRRARGRAAVRQPGRARPAARPGGRRAAAGRAGAAARPGHLPRRAQRRAAARTGCRRRAAPLRRRRRDAARRGSPDRCCSP